MKTIARDCGIIVTALLVWKLAHVLVALAATPFIPLHYPMTAFRDLSFTDFGLRLPYWLKIWANFDGFYYLEISKNGYMPGLVPFFPLYPMLIYAIRVVFEVRRIIIGQVISVGALVFGLIIAVQLLRKDLGKRKAAILPFLGVILTFPTSFFYGATYNDSLFFLLATLTLWCARQKLWLSASLSGALATVTRLNGLALFPFLIVEYVLNDAAVQRSWQLPYLKQRVRAVWERRSRWLPLVFFCLIPIAFLGYLAFIHITFGNWRLLFTAMAPWGQNRMILPPQVIWRYLKIFFLSFQPLTVVWWVAVWEFAAVLLYIFLLWRTWGTLRLSYWTFFAISVLIPWTTGTFQGMPRYGLHLYPLYLALFLSIQTMKTWQKIFYYAVMILISTLAITLFTRGIFVA